MVDIHDGQVGRDSALLAIDSPVGQDAMSVARVTIPNRGVVVAHVPTPDRWLLSLAVEVPEAKAHLDREPEGCL